MMTADIVTKESEIKEKIIYGDLDMSDYDPRPEALGSVKYLCTDLTDIRRYYVRLGFHLEEFDRCGYYRDFGYDNLYDFCENNLGLDKSAVSRCINVYLEFNASAETKYIGNMKSSGCAMELADRWKNYSYTQLCEMLPLSDEDRKKILPDMTVKQIREFKKELKEKKSIDPVASTQQECSDENVPDDGEIRDFCQKFLGCLTADEKMNFKKYMVEKYGKTYVMAGNGDIDYECTPRGIRINDSDEITWTHFAKRVKELEEQIPGACFRTYTADGISVASTQPEKEKMPFDNKRYESTFGIVRQNTVKSCSPVRENVVVTVFDKDGKIAYGNIACDLIYAAGGDYYFRLWDSKKEGEEK